MLLEATCQSKGFPGKGILQSEGFLWKGVHWTFGIDQGNECLCPLDLPMDNRKDKLGNQSNPDLCFDTSRAVRSNANPKVHTARHPFGTGLPGRFLGKGILQSEGFLWKGVLGTFPKGIPSGRIGMDWHWRIPSENYAILNEPFTFAFWTFHKANIQYLS